MRTPDERFAGLLRARLRNGLHSCCLLGPPPRLPAVADAPAAGADIQPCSEAEDPRLTSLTAKVKAGCYHVPTQEVVRALLHHLGRR